MIQLPMCFFCPKRSRPCEITRRLTQVDLWSTPKVFLCENNLPKSTTKWCTCTTIKKIDITFLIFSTHTFLMCDNVQWPHMKVRANSIWKSFRKFVVNHTITRRFRHDDIITQRIGLDHKWSITYIYKSATLHMHTHGTTIHTEFRDVK